jgi:hypothetical protein
VALPRMLERPTGRVPDLAGRPVGRSVAVVDELIAQSFRAADRGGVGAGGDVLC